jgi:hypothetical protein
MEKGARVRTITIFTHAGVVTGLAGLFFGSLAWVYNSPYGLGMMLGSLAIFVCGSAFGRYYGFSPMWQPHGWEDVVDEVDKPQASPHGFVISTQQYPPYLVRAAKKQDGARFGTAVYALEGEEVAEEAQALYGLQWPQQQEAETGHRWVVDTLRQGKFAELEQYRAQTEEMMNEE